VSAGRRHRLDAAGTAGREAPVIGLFKKGPPMVSKKSTAAVAMSSADCRAFGYEADDCWAKLPSGLGWPEVAGVAADSRDRVYVFNRGAHPIMVFDRDGAFLFSWREGLFVRAHGICIGPDDSVYCTDDSDH